MSLTLEVGCVGLFRVNRGIDDLLRVQKHLKFALNIAFVVRREYFLHPKSGNLQEVSKSPCVFTSETTRCPHLLYC